MKKPKFYLGRYALALYDADDYLIFIADNPRELAAQFDLKLPCLQSSLAHHKTRLIIKGKTTNLYLIDMREEE